MIRPVLTILLLLVATANSPAAEPAVPAGTPPLVAPAPDRSAPARTEEAPPVVDLMPKSDPAAGKRMESELVRPDTPTRGDDSMLQHEFHGNSRTIFEFSNRPGR